MSTDGGQRDDAPAQPLGGGEVLLLDKDESIREGLRKLLASSGVLVTATGDAQKALVLAKEKHFGAALVDADTPALDEGVQLLREIRAVSPATSVVLLVNRQTFDVAVRGFRGGAVDVVAKVPESVSGLVASVAGCCQETRRVDERDRLLRETMEIHELFLKRLMDASRKTMQAEEMTKGRSDWELKEFSILVVDPAPQTSSDLQEALGKDSIYRCHSAVSGGEALDAASQHRFQMALVNESLPDLPWSILVRSLRGQLPDGLILSFTHPGQRPGHLAIVEETQTIELVAELSRGEQLVDSIHKMREAYLAKSRERRYLAAFRTEHYDFLKRYVELRQKLNALMPREK